MTSNLGNCLDGRDPCFELQKETPTTVDTRLFTAAYDEDHQADLTLVRSRLLADGRVRVVYDLTCANETTLAIGRTITQVNRRGRLIHGTGEKTVSCTAVPSRHRYLVTPTNGRFREARAFIDTDFGDRYEWGVFADDQHPLSLKH